MLRELRIDQNECTGCEYCVDKLPEVFKMNEEGLSTVFNTDGVQDSSIQKVIDGCPAECIRWVV